MKKKLRLCQLIRNVIVNIAKVKMIKIDCPFCEYSIRANELQEEVVCPNCGRRFPLESGDASYINGKK